MSELTESQERVAQALRDLIGSVYADCKGAYGAEYGYTGQYESEIQHLAQLIDPCE